MKEQNPFKEKLYQHTLPVSDALWGRIEAQLPAKVDKKRFPFFWLFLAAVVLTAGIIFYVNSSNKELNKEDIQPDHKEIPTPATKPSVTPEISYHTPSTSENQHASITDNSLIHTASLSTTQEIKETPTVITKPLTESHSIDKRIEKTSASTKTDITSGQATEKTLSKQTAGSKINSSEAKNRPTETPFFESNSVTVPFVQQTMAIASSIDALSSEVSTTNTESTLDLTSILPDPSCYKFTEEESKSNLSVDLFIGGGFAPRSFESNSTEDLLYIEARERTEKNKYTWAAGARVNWNVSEEIVLRAGFMYEQIGDLFDYTDTSATQRTTRIDSFFSADGTFLYAETNTELIFGTLVKKIHNRYHHLDIPLLASYELCLGRSILMVNLGPVINLSTSFRGQILNPAFVPQHITPSESNRIDAYKTNLGLSLYVGAGALIPLNKNFSGLIEPRFLYRIKPVTTDHYPLKEHRHFAGLNAGIRYHFD